MGRKIVSSKWIRGPFALLMTASAIFLLTRARDGDAPAAVESRVEVASAVDASTTALEPETDEGLVAPAMLLGRVVDERGQAVSDAEVIASSAALGALRTRTDPWGSFRVALPRSGTWQVAASAPGRRGAEQSVRVPREGLEIELALDAAASLAGRVRAGRSDPSSFRVRLESEAGDELQAECDAQGEYRFDSLDPGRYRVHLDARARRVEGVATIEVRAGESATLDLDAPASGAIALRAQLPEAWAGREQRVQIELQKLDTREQSRLARMLDAGGRASIDDLASGEYDLRVIVGTSTPSRVVRARVGESGTTEVAVRWEGGRIEGRVLDAPKPGETVRAQRLIERGASRVVESGVAYEAAPDASGRYRIDGLAPGEYLVSSASGARAPERVLLAQDGRAEANLARAATRALDVRVESRGAPVADADVFAMRAPHLDWVGRGKTDARGRARILGVTSGSYRLVARVLSEGDLRTASAEARVTDGSMSPVTLELELR